MTHDTTATLIGEVHELRVENERLKGIVLRQNRRVGPYFIGQWTDEISHVDPCDCDLDEEEAGENCMAASEWTYGVFVDGGAFAPRLITKLPRRPPEQSDDDTPPDWLAEVETLRAEVERRGSWTTLRVEVERLTQERDEWRASAEALGGAVLNVIETLR